MSESPLIIKKYHGIYSQKKPTPISVTQTFYQKKAFSFKKYKSDRERINEILEKNAVLEEYYKKMSKEKERVNKIYQMKLAPKLIQPNMHFQYKNADSLINRKLAKKIKELTKKSKSVNNYMTEEPNEDSENIKDKTNILDNNNDDEYNKINNNFIGNDYNLTEEQIRKRNMHNKIIKDRKSMIDVRKLLMNLEEINLGKKNNKSNIDEEYIKTQFKAMENIRMFKTAAMNNIILKKWEKEDKENQMNIKLNKLLNLTEGNNRTGNNFNKSFTRNNKSNTEFFTTKKCNNKKNANSLNLKRMYSVDEFDLNNTNSEINSYVDNKGFYNFNNIIKEKPYIENRKQKLSEDKKILNNFKIADVISRKNPLLYKLYFSDIKSKENNIGINEEQFDQIKKLAFKEKKDNIHISNSENDKLEEEDHNEDINIYNKKYKRLSVDKLAKKILTETNYNLKNNYKSKYGLMNKA